MAFSFQIAHKGFLLADYLLHTEKYSIACVNKQKPTMHCDGKCQLAKKINTDNDTKQPLNSQTNPDRYFEILMFFERIPNFHFTTPIERKCIIPFYQPIKGFEINHFVFHPPIL